MSDKHIKDDVEIEKGSLSSGEDGPRSPSDAEYSIDPVAEAKLRRKLDMTVMPLFAFTYMLTFLDRGNIGNAKAAGLVKDLNLGTFDFNIGTCLFYVMYLLFDFPFSLAVKRYGTWIVPAAVFSFGFITLATAFITDKAGFYITRVFLGICESAVLPGITYISTRFYRRHELTYRVGFFLVMAAGPAGGFGGLLAAGLLHVGHIGSRHSWQNIFLVEGIITIGFGAILYFVFPAHPEQTKLFNEEERKLAVARIFADQPSIRESKEEISWPLIKRAFLNPSILACVWLFIVNSSTIQGLGIFLPSILAINYPTASPTRIQLLVVPIYVCATIVALCTSYIIIKTKKHWPICVLGACMLIVGYGIWIATPASAQKIRYAGCFLNLMGGFVSGPSILGWAAANASPDTVRAMVGAVVTGFGQLGAVAGVWAYIQTDAKTGFHKGNSFNLFMGASQAVVGLGLAAYQGWENKKRARGERDYRLQQDDVHLLGNLHPHFKLIQ